MPERSQPSPQPPNGDVAGGERPDGVEREPAVTMAAERYIMSGSRAARLHTASALLAKGYCQG